VNPVVLGSGLPFFPGVDVPVRLRRHDGRTFASGVELLRYEVLRD
jgi:hypothetical protein